MRLLKHPNNEAPLLFGLARALLVVHPEVPRHRRRFLPLFLPLLLPLLHGRGPVLLLVVIDGVDDRRGLRRLARPSPTRLQLLHPGPRLQLLHPGLRRPLLLLDPRRALLILAPDPRASRAASSRAYRAARSSSVSEPADFDVDRDDSVDVDAVEMTRLTPTLGLITRSFGFIAGRGGGGGGGSGSSDGAGSGAGSGAGDVVASFATSASLAASLSSLSSLSLASLARRLRSYSPRCPSPTAAPTRPARVPPSRRCPPPHVRLRGLGPLAAAHVHVREPGAEEKDEKHGDVDPAQPSTGRCGSKGGRDPRRGAAAGGGGGGRVGFGGGALRTGGPGARRNATSSELSSSSKLAMASSLKSPACFEPGTRPSPFCFRLPPELSMRLAMERPWDARGLAHDANPASASRPAPA